MPKQSPLRIIKRCRIYDEKSDIQRYDIHKTRGFYILYKKENENYNVKYIGVGGIGRNQNNGVFARLKSHSKNKKDWDCYSIFEVHDNITREEIRELEILLLTIFRLDKNVQLLNKQFKSNVIKKLKSESMWPDIKEKKLKKSRLANS